ncbi:GCN2 alpha-related protein kinase, putative [Plasmodium chabaudi adami]|uniref:GCN2 alpha-related protein kinase, putative n=1 Tax=Plasmodium chabaudi adami TaxID=5826 RepID=A0A1C6XU71_PLACE|nr:GCN2 alpha-related protein kinase, putative [Plasmodium chabaudi adami]
METDKINNGDDPLVSAGKLINDIYALSSIKDIDIDIIQEGLLKKVMDDEETNGIMFAEDTSNSKNECIILNIRINVDKNNYGSNKYELGYADISVNIDFNKKEYNYSLDNSKLHKCYYYKITTFLNYIIEKKLNFKDSIMYLYSHTNDYNSMKCSCWVDDKNVEPILESKMNDTIKVEKKEKKLDNTALKKKDHFTEYSKGYIKANTENEREETNAKLKRKTCTVRSFSEDNISFTNNMGSRSGSSKFNEISSSGFLERGINKSGADTDSEIVKRKQADMNITKKIKSDAFNELLEKKGKNKIEENFKHDDNNKSINYSTEERNSKREDIKFSIKDAEEISDFLKTDYLNKTKKIKLNNMTEIDKNNIYEKEERKKKKFIKIMKENIPLTVLLASNGNGICKEIINKYSRYYRDFSEESVLGCGGFGYVMKVKNKKFNIAYAVKKITLSSYSPNKRENENDMVRKYNNNVKKGNKYNEIEHMASRSFSSGNNIMNENNSLIMEEVIMIAKLQHENIVRYYDAWVENNIDYYLFKEIENNYKSVIKKKNKENKKNIYYIDEINNIRNYYNKKNKESIKINEKYLYILMEYCPGKTLREAIDCGFIYKNEKLIWELIKQILKGIYYIHDMKIMHRDIKPSNIFLQINDDILSAKIGDFGLTTKIDNTQINPSAGTVNYMSPEQINGEHFDQKADIFSLGVVFFEMFHEPFSTSMERSIVLSNLLKCIYPESIRSDNKIFQFLLSLLEIDPQKRLSAYSLLHENFFFSYEKKFNEIYNLVEKKRNCEEVQTIISTLFEKNDNKIEKNSIKKEDMVAFQGAKIFSEESNIKKSIKKKIILSFKKRGAIFLITPIILRNKYYINFENITIDEYNYSYNINKKKENKCKSIFINTNACNNIENVVYLLDIYGNIITLRNSFFLSFSEYIYENIDCYDKYNETLLFWKFYTKGYTYKYQIAKNKQPKKDMSTTNLYPDEVEKIFYCILINTKNVYSQEEFNYISIFANSDIFVSIYTLCNHASYFNKLIFVWSYIDLLPLILIECLDLPEDTSYDLAIILKKNSSQLINKSAISLLIQKFKLENNNISKVTDFIFNLFQIKCEINKIDEYFSILERFLFDPLSKRNSDFNNTYNNSIMCNTTINNVGSMNTPKSSCKNVGNNNIGCTNNSGHISSSNINGINNNSLVTYDEKENPSYENDNCRTEYDGHKKYSNETEKCIKVMENKEKKINLLSVLDKVKNINKFIGTNTIIENVYFDIFLNYDENVFSNEIIFYVISDSKNKDIIAHGGKFDKLIRNMNNQKCANISHNNTNDNGVKNNSSVHIKAYGVEIYLEKIFTKITESNDKLSMNTQTTSGGDKFQIFNNFSLLHDYQNNFECTNNLISSQLNTGQFNYSCPKILIQVYEIENLLVAYDVSKKLLNKNIYSYIFFSANSANIKKKVKIFKPHKIKFIISIKSNSNDTAFNVNNPIQLNDVIYKIYNSDIQDYHFTNQEELINFLIKNL